MKRGTKIAVMMGVDIVLLTLSVFLAFLLRFDFNVSYLIKYYIDGFFYMFLLSVIIKILCFWVFRLYSSLWKYAGMHEALNVIMAVLVADALVTLISYALPIKIPTTVLISISLLDILLIVGARFVYRLGWTFVKSKVFSTKTSGKKLMIIGAGDAGSVIIKELETSSSLTSVAVAIIDDNPDKKGTKLHGVPVMGTRKDIVKVAAQKNIDEIIIAIPSAPQSEVNDILRECTKTNCRIRILPSISHLIDGKVSIKKVRDFQIEDLLGRKPVELDKDNIASYLKGKRIMVTGGGGSIGSELCRQISFFSPELLILLDNYENNAFEISNELKYMCPELNFNTVIANVREGDTMELIFEKYKPQVVFHAAAHKHVPLMEGNPSEAVKNNIFGTLNLVRAADKNEVEKFILISTDKAVNPTNVMGATKRIAEMVLQAVARTSKTDFSAVRFGNVLGSNGSVIPFFKKQIEQGGPVTVTHPEVTRFFMTIQEAVQLVMQAGAMAKGGEIFVLDMGQPVKIHDLARILIKLSGFKPDEDIKIIFTGLRPGEKLFEELLLEEEGLRTTRHDKIFVAAPIFTDYALLLKELEILKGLLSRDEDIIAYLPNIVPGYQRATNGHNGPEEAGKSNLRQMQ